MELFKDDCSDSDIDVKINKDYASKYDTWRQKEELNKLKTKYGNPENLSDVDEDSSSSDDDDEGNEISEQFEKEFFKTLSCLKKKDPKIYDNQVEFFTEEPVKNEDTGRKKAKDESLFLKDYERKVILEKGGKFEDSDDDAEENARVQSPTYVEEQKKIQESLKDALKIEDDEDETHNWGGLFKKRQKTKEEEDEEEQDYKKWLKGNKAELDNKTEESELKPLKDYWRDPNLDEGETFLRDYLLNKRYLDKDNGNYIPTYDQIVHDSDENLSEDEKAISAQDEFEHKYNFRFEEPDDEFIKRYPRVMAQSVRKTDDRRKVKRTEIKERKEREKQEKKADLKQLKLLKMHEIKEKIEKLKEITGNEKMAFQEADLEDDFDPEVHDKRMKELFSDEYYEELEGDYKPDFSNLDEELGLYKDELHCEDEDFNMDCDYDPSQIKTKEESKRKKRTKSGKKATKDEEVLLVENNEDYEEYMDEIHKLDYEDMIGDIPCRFKYREVVPNDFGLSVEEILLAKDKELNRWCSLKKVTQYRQEHVEKYDVIAYQAKAVNLRHKKKILPSIFVENPNETDDNVENNTQENDELTKKNTTNVEEESSKSDGIQKKKKKGKKPHVEQASNDNKEEFEEMKSQNSENGNKDDSISKKKRKKLVEEQISKDKFESDEIKQQNSENFEQPTNKNDIICKTKRKREHVNNNNESKIKKENLESAAEFDIKGNIQKKKKKRTSKANETESTEIFVHTSENKKNTSEKKNLAGPNMGSNDNNPEICKANPSKKNNLGDEAQQEIISDKLTINDKSSNILSRRQRRNIKRKESLTNNERKTTEKKRKLSESEAIDIPKKKLKSNKIKKSTFSKSVNNNIQVSDSRLEAYGINPKKFKNKLKYKNVKEKGENK